MDKDWASKHLTSDPKPYVPAPVKRRSPWPTVATLLLLGVIGGSGFWLWKSGFLSEFIGDINSSIAEESPLEQVTPANPAAAQTVRQTYREPTEPFSTIRAVEEPAQAPAMPQSDPAEQARIEQRNATQRAQIQRGIDNLSKQRTVSFNAMTALDRQIDAAMNAKLYPQGRPQYNYEEYMAIMIRQAQGKTDGSKNTLIIQLGNYRDKLNELKAKRSHEASVVDSLDKRIEAERQKIP